MDIPHADKVREIQSVILDERRQLNENSRQQYLDRIKLAIQEYKTALHNKLCLSIKKFLTHPHWTYVTFSIDDLTPNKFQGFKSTTLTCGWFNKEHGTFDVDYLLQANNNKLPFNEVSEEFKRYKYDVAYDPRSKRVLIELS